MKYLKKDIKCYTKYVNKFFHDILLNKNPNLKYLL